MLQACSHPRSDGGAAPVCTPSRSGATGDRSRQVATSCHRWTIPALAVARHNSASSRSRLVVVVGLSTHGDRSSDGRSATPTSRLEITTCRPARRPAVRHGGKPARQLSHQLQHVALVAIREVEEPPLAESLSTSLTAQPPLASTSVGHAGLRLLPLAHRYASTTIAASPFCQDGNHRLPAASRASRVALGCRVALGRPCSPIRRLFALQACCRLRDASGRAWAPATGRWS
jgi:hypothetical protein